MIRFRKLRSIWLNYRGKKRKLFKNHLRFQFIATPRKILTDINKQIYFNDQLNEWELTLWIKLSSITNSQICLMSPKYHNLNYSTIQALIFHWPRKLAANSAFPSWFLNDQLTYLNPNITNTRLIHFLRNQFLSELTWK